MKEPSLPGYKIRQIAVLYLGILLAVAILLGVLHFFFSEIHTEGLYWFHLDKERNIPTWFSGTLFFLFGSTALLAFYWERQINVEGPGSPIFRLPVLWLGVSLIGWLMSLDEITILHENLLWRQVRQTTYDIGQGWVYLTQWQILFLPVIVLALSYFVLLFTNRLGSSSSARRLIISGLGLWLTALALESLRGTFLRFGDRWYDLAVLVEEEAEMLGAISLLASLVFYVLDIKLDLTDARRQQLQQASRFLTQRSLVMLTVVLTSLILIGAIAFSLASRQAVAGESIPELHQQALKDSLDNTHRLAVSPDEVWFDDIQTNTSISHSDGEDLTWLIIKALLETDPPQINHDQIPPDHTPRIVFLSLSDGMSPAVVVSGSGDDIAMALDEVLLQAEVFVEGGLQIKWIKVDFVQDVHHLTDVESDIVDHPAFTSGLYGLAFDRTSGLALLPEEITDQNLVTGDQGLDFEHITPYFDESSAFLQQLESVEPLTVYRFTTLSFFADGQAVIPLYRGHRLFDQIPADELLESAIEGGKYLTRSVDDRGLFNYLYDPVRDTSPDTYNILRHAGATYAMLELYEETGDRELLQAASRAVDYLVHTALPCSAGLCIVENDEVKLGGNALAIIALAKYTEVMGDDQYLPMMIDLGRWIQSVQSDTGQIFVHKQTYSGGEILDFRSQYYPGEALLALTRLYALDANESWLDSAERTAHYLINDRDGELTLSEITHDHWLLIALNELNSQRPDPLYVEHALFIAEAIIQSQNQTPSHPDWLGSYYQPPRSTPTATRSEGLVAAYWVAQNSGAGGQAQDILAALRTSISFQLQTQLRPESVMYFDNPQRALGGFQGSLTDNEIRIDYVQHNISSLIGLYHIEQYIEGHH